MSNTNLLMLEDVASKLGTMKESVAFVGGATLGLLITDIAAAPVRATIDVDVIAEIATYLDYIAFSEELRKRGFHEDSRDGAPICRWLNGELILDVMPTDQSVFGFSNRWYRSALKAAQPFRLPSGQSIQVITAPYFLGTKVEAFAGRGNRDFYSSHDLEDVVSVIDGRESLVRETAESPDDLRGFLSGAVQRLLAEPRFLDALPGYLLPDKGSQQRIAALLRKLREISEM